MFEIEILNPVECRCLPALAKIIKPALSYTSAFYVSGQYRKIRREYQKCIMSNDATHYYFYTGLLKRVLDYCKERNIPVVLKGEEEKLPSQGYNIPNIVFREEQKRLINAAIKAQRGVLVAPTGEGKTLIGVAIISAFKKQKVLWLCHTKDLMYQSGKVAEKELQSKVGYVGDGHCDLSCDYTFATRQSFAKLAEEHGHLYDVVICDEVHHCGSLDTRKKVDNKWIEVPSEYAFIMQNIFAPVRIGLTATLPTSQESLLAIESMLGPTVEEVTIQEAQDLKVMADIKIKFIKVPVSHKIKELRAYKDVYEYGVVHRKETHVLIALEAQQHVQNNKSVLVLVTRIDHGILLAEAIKEKGVDVFFANGSTETNVRNEIKEALNSKKIKCVIASTIFKEGINLPELNVIINAAGGKSEISTLQSVGRGLRLTETKKELLLVDVIDLSHHYLVSHLAERLALYSEKNWL